jgi:hypothetical protein
LLTHGCNGCIRNGKHQEIAMNRTDWTTVGKDGLRAACKAAGISYGKLNNDGMRAALVKLEDEALAEETQATAEATSEPVVQTLGEMLGDNLSDTDVRNPDPVPAPVEQKAPGKTAGLKIEKDREERNGVKRPSEGGLCRAIWDWLDTQPGASAKDVKAKAAEMGWNPNNASIEYYQWRKFNGVRGRQTAAKTTEG